MSSGRGGLRLVDFDKDAVSQRGDGLVLVFVGGVREREGQRGDEEGKTGERLEEKTGGGDGDGDGNDERRLG